MVTRKWTKCEGKLRLSPIGSFHFTLMIYALEFFRTLFIVLLDSKWHRRWMKLTYNEGRKFRLMELSELKLDFPRISATLMTGTPKVIPNFICYKARLS